MNQSNFLSLNWRDFLRGLAMAVLTPVVLIIQQSLEAGNLVFNWKAIGMAAIAGGVAYLVKNLLTKPDTAKKDIIGDRPGDRG
jgi:hypothetical protein